MIDKKHYFIIAKTDECSQNLAQEMHTTFALNNWEISKDHPDLVVTVGGDGTFLHAIHSYLDQLDTIKVVGIHTGTLGFFTNYHDHELDIFFDDLFNRKMTIHPIPVMRIKVNQKGESFIFEAINEMRIENVTRTQSLDIKINGEFFESFRGTGMCISTQAGSTAYNRSLGGAILQDGLDLLQIAEITGIHHKAYRSLGSPMIVKKESIIELFSDDFDNAILCYDHLNFPLNCESQITVSYSNKYIRLLTRPNYTYFKRLKNLF